MRESSRRMIRDAHCSYCGHPFAGDAGWPRACAGCRQISYRNPVPVAVALVPVGGGLLCVRRNIEPCKGLLALPGGYIDFGETWETAASREVREETGLIVPPEDFRVFDVASAPNGTLLIFGLARTERPMEFLDGLALCPEETMECVVAREPIELAFDLHTRMMMTHFHARMG